MRSILALALLLAGCAFGSADNTPQGQCRLQADNDPTVKEFYQTTPGLYTVSGSANEELKVLVRDAYNRCLQAKGLAPPGGVEAVRAR
jgi:hypothetical protein